MSAATAPSPKRHLRCTLCGEPPRDGEIVVRADGSWEHVDCDLTTKDELKVAATGTCPVCFAERSATGDCWC